MNILTANGTVKQLFFTNRKGQKGGKEFKVEIDKGRNSHPIPQIIIPPLSFPVSRPRTVIIQAPLVARSCEIATQTDEQQPLKIIESPAEATVPATQTAQQTHPQIIVNNTLTPQFHRDRNQNQYREPERPEGQESKRDEQRPRKRSARRRRRSYSSESSIDTIADDSYAISSTAVQLTPSSLALLLKKAKVLERLNGAASKKNYT
jgi:hypothetical protein